MKSINKNNSKLITKISNDKINFNKLTINYTKLSKEYYKDKKIAIWKLIEDIWWKNNENTEMAKDAIDRSFSDEKWLDWSMLIRYFMKSFTNKPEIVNFDIRDSFFDSMMNDSQITTKLEKISNKLDKIWF